MIERPEMVKDDFNGEAHKSNENQGMRGGFSVHPNISESCQPAKRGQIENPALAQQQESFEEYGNQAPYAFVFANVCEIIEKSLLPIPNSPSTRSGSQNI